MLIGAANALYSKFRVNEGVVNVGAVSVQIVPSNSDRIFLIISNTGAGGIRVSTRSSISSTQGISIPNGLGHMQLSYQLCGSLVGQAWYLASGAGGSAAFVEVLENPSIPE